MNEQDFLKRLAKCSKPYYTGSGGLICIVNPERTRYIIKKKIPENKKVCPCCGSDLSKNPQEIEVLFNSPQEHLSIFQAELLFFMYRENRKPFDYASYHKCEAGKKFINNILEVKGGIEKDGI